MSQRLVRCIEGHVYDEEAMETCPVCGATKQQPPASGESKSSQQTSELGGADDIAPNGRDHRLHWAAGGVAAVVLLAVGSWTVLPHGTAKKQSEPAPQATSEQHQDRDEKQSSNLPPAPTDSGVDSKSEANSKSSEANSKSDSSSKPNVADSGATDCDRYAMSPVDLDRVAGVEGVGQINGINAAVAVPACEKAVEAARDNRRLWVDLGRAYRAAKNDKSAADAYRHAADAGSAFGAYALGVLLRDGTGVQEDAAEARRYFRLAAEANFDVGMVEYADLLNAGTGGDQNEAEARRWYERASDAGNTTGMNRLGRYLVDGVAGPKNLARARTLFVTAASKGDTTGLVNLGFLAENGTDGPKDLNLAQQRYEEAAKSGNTLAMRRLADMALAGRSKTLQPVDARKWLEQAANHGDATAMADLGQYLVDGKFGNQDFLSGRQWLESAAARGNGDAMNSLGALYHSGIGVPRDYQAARDWLNKAANRGNIQALASLGVLFEFGEGVRQNFPVAWRLFNQAAAKGNAFAIWHLGQMAEYGKGMAVDRIQARDLYLKAAKLGSADAGWSLALLFDRYAGNKDTTWIAADVLNAAKAGSSDARDALMGSGRSLSREVMAAIQSELSKQGLYTGPINGRKGRNMRDAVAAYLRGEGNPQANAQSTSVPDTISSPGPPR